MINAEFLTMQHLLNAASKEREEQAKAALLSGITLSELEKLIENNTERSHEKKWVGGVHYENTATFVNHEGEIKTINTLTGEYCSTPHVLRAKQQLANTPIKFMLRCRNYCIKRIAEIFRYLSQ